MELNALSITIGIVGVFVSLAVLFYGTMWMKNTDRYSYPKFLPRDDEVIWAKAVAIPARIWSYRKTKAMYFDNWDLGILAVNPEDLKRIYGTVPRVTDVILVPRKWGGFWAVVITKRLRNHRFVSTFLGEFRNGKIRKNRNPQNIIFVE